MNVTLSTHFLPVVLIAHHTNKMPFARLKLPCLSFDDVSALNCKSDHSLWSDISDLRRQFYFLDMTYWQIGCVLTKFKALFLTQFGFLFYS